MEKNRGLKIEKAIIDSIIFVKLAVLQSSGLFRVAESGLSVSFFSRRVQSVVLSVQIFRAEVIRSVYIRPAFASLSSCGVNCIAAVLSCGAFFTVWCCQCLFIFPHPVKSGFGVRGAIELWFILVPALVFCFGCFCITGFVSCFRCFLPSVCVWPLSNLVAT